MAPLLPGDAPWYATAAGHDGCVELLSDTGAQANHQDKVRLCCTNE